MQTCCRSFYRRDKLGCLKVFDSCSLQRSEMFSKKADPKKLGICVCEILVHTGCFRPGVPVCAPTEGELGM